MDKLPNSILPILTRINNAKGTKTKRLKPLTKICLNLALLEGAGSSGLFLCS